MCRCGHDLALHNPCSICECGTFVQLQSRGAGKARESNRKTFPKRPK